MNNFILVGNIEREPEIKETNSGLKYCQLLIREKRTFKNSDGKYESDLYNVTLWKNLAEGEYKEGSFVAVRGRLQANNYDKEGVTYYHPDLVAEKVQFIEC